MIWLLADLKVDITSVNPIVSLEKETNIPLINQTSIPDLVDRNPHFLACSSVFSNFPHVLGIFGASTAPPASVRCIAGFGVPESLVWTTWRRSECRAIDMGISMAL
jgi:hypothetical protein